MFVLRGTRRPSAQGQTFEQPPSIVCDLDESGLDFRVHAVLLRSQSVPLRFAADKIGNRLRHESESMQSIHATAREGVENPGSSGLPTEQLLEP